MSVKYIDTGYRPRELQDILHRLVKRFNVIVCHRRFGKTVFSINELVDRSLRCDKKNPQYAYIAPTYGQAKKIAWDMLKEYTKAIPGVTTNEAELRLEIPRPDRNDKIKIILLGAENPDSIRGLYLDGVILDEFADMNPIVWTSVVRPALSDRLGWAIFIGTVRGRNHFFDIYQAAQGKEDWHTAVYKASQTGIIPQEELDAAREIMSEEEYMQEYECDWGAALIGAYYGKQMSEAESSGRIRQVPYDPAVPVETWWDLGIGDSTAIWFTQKVAGEFRIIDSLEMSGVGLDWYVRELRKKPYIYGDINLPHDSAARDLTTGKTRVEVLRELWKGIRINVLPRLSVEDGINAARLILHKCWFDLEKCERGIAALRSYQKKWDPKNKIYQDKPLHDWSSHFADAFRMFAIGNKYDRESINIKNLPREADNAFDIFH